MLLQEICLPLGSVFNQSALFFPANTGNGIAALQFLVGALNSGSLFDPSFVVAGRVNKFESQSPLGQKLK